MTGFIRGITFIAALGTLYSGTALGAEASNPADSGTKVAYRPAANSTDPAFRLSNNDEYVLSAAPREDAAEADADRRPAPPAPSLPPAAYAIHSSFDPT